MTHGSPFKTGTLWARIRERTRSARRSGAQRPIATRTQWVEEAGVRFVVRVVSALAEKDRARRARTDDPFLAPEAALFVADLSATHYCLLNKFNVIDHHLLIVTRRFEHQEAPLSQTDFEAACTCMAEFEGLLFYNAGRIAGASEPHRHLQMVPLPLAAGAAAVPIEPLLVEAAFRDGVGAAPRLPFVHALCRLDDLPAPPRAAAALFDRYRALLDAVGLRAHVGEGPRLAPYNLLLTRRWMWLVPRVRECFRGVSINALGFAGALLVRDARELAAIEARGPLGVLRDVAVPRDRVGPLTS